MSWFREARVAKEYHWAEVSNFGDALAPLLLKRFADLDTQWGTVSHSRIVTVGSILEHVPPLWDGIILGTGKLREDSQLHLLSGGGPRPTATILGLRGPLTARQCPAGNYAIGDPGLMVDQLVPAQDKLYDLGVIPHWSDKQLATRPEFQATGQWKVKVIDPRGEPASVITEIARCHRVVTSSLHGAISADAFGIPRRIEPDGIKWTKDRLFKWRDYHASISMKWEAGKMAEPRRLLVDDRQFGLFTAYIALGDLVRAGGNW